MAVGTVKWFDSTKGFGFLSPDAGGADIFIHISAVERSGLQSLDKGQKVEYEVVTNKGRPAAANIKLI